MTHQTYIIGLECVYYKSDWIVLIVFWLVRTDGSVLGSGQLRPIIRLVRNPKISSMVHIVIDVRFRNPCIIYPYLL